MGVEVGGCGARNRDLFLDGGENKKKEKKCLLALTLARKMADAAGSSSSARCSRISFTSSTRFAGFS